MPLRLHAPGAYAWLAWLSAVAISRVSGATRPMMSRTYPCVARLARYGGHLELWRDAADAAPAARVRPSWGAMADSYSSLLRHAILIWHAIRNRCGQAGGASSCSRPTTAAFTVIRARCAAPRAACGGASRCTTTHPCRRQQTAVTTGDATWRTTLFSSTAVSGRLALFDAQA